MSQSRHRPYEIVESASFLEQVQELMGSFERWDEIRETIDIEIASNPTRFPQIHGTPIRAVGLATPSPKTLYFMVDNSVVNQFS